MPRLRLVASPLVREGFTLTSSSDNSTTNVERKPQPVVSNSFSSGQRDIGEPHPKFVRHEESTNIELFYDLFFVANLASFSSVHDVNSRKMLTSYMGFFCILWFTWCQTSLFDVRFVADSWMERVAKASHLGVMVALAVVGPNYDTQEKVNNETGLVDKQKTASELQSLALILVVSRFILSLQYLHILFQVRNFRHTKLPLGLLSGYNVVAAAIYFIVAFAFKKHEHAYRALYVIAIVEMIVNIAVSSRWKVLSFRRTHLCERMSLLTLYILGEGVIDILNTVGQLVQVDSQWTSGTIGLLVATIAGIYMFYMLYFDCLNHKYFGSIRQQIWAFAHFPFHVALVLALSGMAVLEKWYQVVLVIQPPLAEFIGTVTEIIPTFYDLDTLDALPPLSNDTFNRLASNLSDIVYQLFDKYPPVYTITSDEVDWALGNITLGYISEAPNATDVFVSKAFWFADILNLQSTMEHSIFVTYGLELAESVLAAIENSDEILHDYREYQADFQLVATVYEYFLVSAGLSIILLGFMMLIMDTHKRWAFGTVIRFVSHIVVGVPLAALAAMKGGPDQISTGFSFELSPWVIPTYTIAIFIVLAFHHIKWGKNDDEIEVKNHIPEREDC